VLGLEKIEKYEKNMRAYLAEGYREDVDNMFTKRKTLSSAFQKLLTMKKA
jgi:hypothetical protein